MKTKLVLIGIAILVVAAVVIYVKKSRKKCNCPDCDGKTCPKK
jgi:hypothetical protein